MTVLSYPEVTESVLMTEYEYEYYSVFSQRKWPKYEYEYYSVSKSYTNTIASIRPEVFK